MTQDYYVWTEYIVDVFLSVMNHVFQKLCYLLGQIEMYNSNIVAMKSQA